MRSSIKHAIKRAFVPAAVTGVVAAAILGTPELITLGILTAVGFVSAVIGVLTFWRLAPVDSWNPSKQRAGIWLAACVAAPAGCLLILAPAMVR
jgi:uncharacterized membrane protein YvlD (DUF360 family)